MSATMSSGTAAMRGGRTSRPARLVSGIAVALGCVLFLGGFGWTALQYRPYTVPTSSMQPTVDPGGKVLAHKISGSEVRRGDVVVFKDQLWGNMPLVKRVVGLGGDTVACCDKQGLLTIDGTPVHEDYLKGGGPASIDAFSTKVPAGELFVLGDNRAISEDSRVHLDDVQNGSVPARDVKGRVDALAWPMSRIGMLPATSAFDALPDRGGGPSGSPLPWIAAMIVAGAVLILAGAAYEPAARVVRRHG